jgi:hypothetical protein
MSKEILIKAIEFFGRQTQINKIQEEALELALVLNQMNCPTKDPVEMDHALYSELADMKIMMMQAEILFDAKRIDDMVKYKLNLLNNKYLNATP